MPVVSSLVNKSLVRSVSPADDEARFEMLETLREYALERVTHAGELAAARTAHANHFSTFAEAQPAWPRLEREQENLRQALRWWIEHDAERAVRLAVLLAPFWEARGHLREGRQWLGQGLARYTAPTSIRARGLLRAGIFAQQAGDDADAARLLDEALPVFHAVEDLAGTAETLRAAGWLAYDRGQRERALHLFDESLAMFRNLRDKGMVATMLSDLAHLLGHSAADLSQARAYAVESLAVFRELNQPEGIAYALQQIGIVETQAGNYAKARAAHTESLDLLRHQQVSRSLGWALALVGEAAWHQGDLGAARACWQEALALFQSMEMRYGLMMVLHHLGQVERRSGVLDKAAQHYRQSLAICWELRDLYVVSRCLAGLGALALARAEPERAAHLLGAAYHLFDLLPPFLAPADQAEYTAFVTDVRAALGDDAFALAWDAGRQLSTEETMALALNERASR
jgi:tetratricopeptide (TPR) repeat protein